VAHVITALGSHGMCGCAASALLSMQHDSPNIISNTAKSPIQPPLLFLPPPGSRLISSSTSVTHSHLLIKRHHRRVYNSQALKSYLLVFISSLHMTHTSDLSSSQPVNPTITLHNHLLPPLKSRQSIIKVTQRTRIPSHHHLRTTMKK
jgi:hypothetical protein